MVTKIDTMDVLSDPGRRPDVEHELTNKYHAKWTFVSGVSPDKFDLDKSLHNQARFEPIDEKTVQLYTEAVKRGDNFPAVIAYRPGARQRYVIIDGNHRLSAHTNADAPLDVYEIDRDTDPRTIALMTFAFNTKHGRPTSEQERIVQAIYLVDNGASLEAAASSVNIPARILRKALAKQKADMRADEVGLKRNEWDTLTPTVKNRLLNISTDEGFRDAAHLAFAAKLDANEVFDLVQLVNSSRSATKQQALVKQQREVMLERIQDSGGGLLATGGRGRGMGPRQRAGIAVAKLMALPEDDNQIIGMYAEPERSNAAKSMREAGDRLLRLASKLDPKAK